MASDSTHRYQLKIDPETGVYYFITAANITYFCSFRNISPSLNPILGIYDLSILEFDFSRLLPDELLPGDAKQDTGVSLTITYLLNEVFNSKNQIVVYLCDSTDGRAAQRMKLFGRWHMEHLSDAILQHPITVKYVGYEDVYGCILVRKDFEHEDIIREYLVNEAEGFISTKFEAQMRDRLSS